MIYIYIQKLNSVNLKLKLKLIFIYVLRRMALCTSSDFEKFLPLSSYSLNKIKCPCSCRNMGRMFRRLYNYQLNHIEDYKSQQNRWQIDNIDDFIYIHTKILKWWKRDNINYLEVLRRTFTPNETYQIIKILDSCNCCLRHQCDRDKI